jgi:basic membrane lipoprotein Med (substrate-binding protein (PBP1-ABC) superfamily)
MKRKLSMFLLVILALVLAACQAPAAATEAPATEDATGAPARGELEFTVTWIGFWFNIPGVTLDPTEVTNQFFDSGSDVVISGIDTTPAIVVAGQRADQGERVFAAPYDYRGACSEAPDACLGVPFFNWGPSYVSEIQSAMDGTWEQHWTWLDADWSDLTNPDTSHVGWVSGPAITGGEPEAATEVPAEHEACTEEDFVFGLILVGPKNDHGWSQAHYEGGLYVEENVPGTCMVVFESLNPADHPEATVESVAAEMIAQGAQLIFTTSDEFEEDTLGAAEANPDVTFMNISGDDAWADGQDAGTAPANLGNIMGRMEDMKAIAGCAAALTTQTGKISYLGPLINFETRRLAASAYLGAKYCYENYPAGGDTNANLTDFIGKLASGEVNVWTGPINLQDGSTYIEDGQAATEQQIWYLPQLLEGMIGPSE